MAYADTFPKWISGELVSNRPKIDCKVDDLENPMQFHQIETFDIYRSIAFSLDQTC